MTALTGEELLAWVESTSHGWRELVAAHPEVLSFPCDIRETTTVAELLKHIVAVELRYAQRLHGTPETSYDDISAQSVENLYEMHRQAMTLLQPLLDCDTVFWDQQIEFLTRSSGTLLATRRVVLVHLFMHSIRHYAQLATLVRQRGVSPAWPMDYLFMAAQPLPPSGQTVR